MLEILDSHRVRIVLHFGFPSSARQIRHGDIAERWSQRASMTNGLESGGNCPFDTGSNAKMSVSLKRQDLPIVDGSRHIIELLNTTTHNCINFDEIGM